MMSDTNEARWEFKVSDLLTKLKDNRELHVTEYNTAFKGYMEKLENKLSSMLSNVQNGVNIDTRITLERPQSHEEDYDRIIEVLDMTPADTVKLTLSEFDKYVRDKWDWTRGFKNTTSGYM